MDGSEVDLDRVVQSTLLGEAMANASVAVLLADDRGQYVAVNDRACELTGYARDVLCGFRAGELAADEASRRIYRNLTEGKMQGRKVIRRRDGAVLACRYWGIPTTVARTTYFALLLWEQKGRRPTVGTQEARWARMGASGRPGSPRGAGASLRFRTRAARRSATSSDRSVRCASR